MGASAQSGQTSSGTDETRNYWMKRTELWMNRVELACAGQTLHGISVYVQLSFFFQAIFQRGAESVESGGLFGLRKLLFNLCALGREIFRVHRLMGHDAVNQPVTADLGWRAGLSDRHPKCGFQDLRGPYILN